MSMAPPPNNPGLMMNRLLTFLLPAACAACLLPAQAEPARTYGEALKRAGSKPAVMLFYGPNVDGVNEAFHQGLVKGGKMRAFQNRCVFLEVPVYQFPDKKQKKEMETIMDGRAIPSGIYSFPCLALVDAAGNLRGTVQSAEEVQSVDKAIEVLLPLIDAYERQEKLLHKADTATSDRRSKLLIEASNIRGVDMPPDSINCGRRNDPKKDKAGFEKRATFDPYEFTGILDTIKPEELDSHVRSFLDTPGYSLRQRQQMLAGYAGKLRRNAFLNIAMGQPNSPEDIAKIRALYTEMRDLDPESMYGVYAEEALRLWVKALEEGRLPTLQDVE